jgi:hypothetical protein
VTWTGCRSADVETRAMDRAGTAICMIILQALRGGADTT